MKIVDLELPDCQVWHDLHVSWVDKPPVGFAKILVACPECGVAHRRGEHPEDECRTGTVDRVMNS